MARILCATNGLPGLLFATLELARRLKADGHGVLYASVPEVRPIVERQGLEFVELASNAYADWLRRDEEQPVWRRLLTRPERLARAADATGAGAFVEALRAHAPDLLLVDGELHEHVVAAWTAGFRMALVNTFVSIWRQPGVAPPHRLARPGSGWKGTPAMASLFWLELRLKKRRRAWWHRLTRAGCDRLAVLGELARRSGCDLARETTTAEWPIPFTYRRLPVLSLHASEFEFDPQVPRHVQFVGPMVPTSRDEGRCSDEDRTRLAQIVGRRTRGAGRPLVYAAFGSFLSTDVGFLRRLVEGVAGRGDRDLVLSLGGRLDPAVLGPLPPGAHAFSWVPQLEALRYADAAIHHGGINTVDECIVHGVPMLVYCGFETDMPGTTARLVHHGLGLAGDRARDTPARIAARIDRVLTDASLGDAIARFRATYARYVSDRVAERAVASLLSAVPHPPTESRP
jgi:UDP:flavonoid glycosyltransferase YjiC (YdhE family)